MNPELRPIRAADLPQVAHLTFPAFAQAFSQDIPPDAPVQPLGFSLWHAGKPAGLALAKADRSEGKAELMSLFITAPHRRQGFGAALLQHMETELSALGMTEISTRFSDRLPGARAFSALLARQGWGEVLRERIRILGHVGKTMKVFRDQSAIIARASRDGLALVPWKDRADEARRHIESRIAAGLAPEWARGGLADGHLDEDFSMLLMVHGRPVGWVICHFHAQARRWAFPVGWIDEEHQKRGWLLVAYAEGARRLEARHGPQAVAVFESSAGLPMMWRVLENRFAPHAELADYVLKAEKALEPAALG